VVCIYTSDGKCKSRGIAQKFYFKLFLLDKRVNYKVLWEEIFVIALDKLSKA
jgi:hypothetical protein